MIGFAAPWVLLALAVLPALWWLLRVTPPAPRVQDFPAIRLLQGLVPRQQTAARTPWWLLALRLCAAALAIIALSGPARQTGPALAGTGPLLLVLDDGWAAAPDWAARLAAAGAVLDQADRAGRAVALLTTAPDGAGAAPGVSTVLPVAEARRRLAALRPQPWPSDRIAAAAALHAGPPTGNVVYLADGLTDGPGWTEFADALAAIGPVLVNRSEAPQMRLLLPPGAEADYLALRLAVPPAPVATQAVVLAQSGDGRTLGRAVITVPAGASQAGAALVLPPELRNRLARLVLEGPAAIGGVVLLDERWHRRPVGLVATDPNAEAPLIGPLFYLHRALDPYAELRVGDLDTLLKRDLSVLILADQSMPPGPAETALADWVAKGGTLIRFAGPALAERPDGLLPVALLAGDRQLGGAMSWTQPAALAPFPPDSPFAGLAIPPDVRVSRQVLAQPGTQLADQTWALLADGTPLVTHAARGAGRIVLFHTTANADWSDLPLSGLFVDMLRRLVALSAGVAGNEDSTALLAPFALLDGFGQTAPPPPAAGAVAADALARSTAGPRHPPGLYGPDGSRRALNLAQGLPLPQIAPDIAGASVAPLGAMAPRTDYAPPLMLAALGLLLIDLLASLRLRGLLIAAALLAAAQPLAAQTTHPALATRLAYVITGDAAVDSAAEAGLAGLSDYVNRRTNAALAPPAGVRPGQDDLSFYPLLYWPVTPAAPALAPPAIAALNGYMAHGGILLIDTGAAPGADAALRRVTAGLSVPPLARLTGAHVLARSFYLLGSFPGRIDAGDVWVQRDQDRGNDSVSPVIIGGNDWAGAWAVDAQGRPAHATMPGGTRQRTLAYRFGVNLVMYALTGNYKGDQVHLPSILERLGQ